MGNTWLTMGLGRPRYHQGRADRQETTIQQEWEGAREPGSQGL
jgi:hypothetical protein